MKTRTKSAFVLLGTLVIGLILGVLMQTAIQNERNERMRSLRNRGALADVILHVVKPHDTAQADAIRAIVGSTEESHANIAREYWEARSNLFDAMHEELVNNVLDRDQARALGAWRERNRRSAHSGNQQGDRDSNRRDDRRSDDRRRP